MTMNIILQCFTNTTNNPPPFRSRILQNLFLFIRLRQHSQKRLPEKISAKHRLCLTCYNLIRAPRPFLSQNPLSSHIKQSLKGYWSCTDVRTSQAPEMEKLKSNAWDLNWLGQNDEQISDGRFVWSSSWVVLIFSSYQHDINKFPFLLDIAVFWNPLGAIVRTTLFVGIVAGVTNCATIRWWTSR